ncbi:MAG: hypothetical protein IPP29_07005 [Bacteroidetes bacterium]|nr:hypothetical protein [Bacteroidota bacterium]
MPKEFSSYEIIVYNSFCQTINFINREIQIDITEQPAGLYFVKISDGKRCMWQR